ncbi:MAG: Fur family transcriptional regulator [bacterium]
MDEAAVRSALRADGRKATPRRLAIAGLLLRTGRALTPEAVHARLRPRMGRLGLPTVYRALEELVRAGLLTRVERADRVRSYAACGAEPGRHHHHIVCTGCGRVDVIGCAFPAAERRRVERRTGYRVSSHTMQVEGRCPACRAKSARR